MLTVRDVRPASVDAARFIAWRYCFESDVDRLLDVPGLCLLALCAGNQAKTLGDAGDMNASAVIYATRHELLAGAALLAPVGSWSIAPHSYKREGRPAEHAPAQTLVQFRTTSIGNFNFHYLDDVADTARKLLPAAVDIALATPATPWDGVAMQPVARLLCAYYLADGAAGFLAGKELHRSPPG